MCKLCASLTGKDNIALIIVLIGYLVISPFLSYAYDEGFYFQYFRWVYLYHVQPYFLWVFGFFYNIINTGSLALNVPFYFIGIDNVLVQQFSEKIPLIFSAFLVGYILNKSLRLLKPNDSYGKYPMLIFLLMPISIFYVDFMANSLIVALLFILLFLVYLQKGRTNFASIFLGAATATFFYPIFFFLPFLKIVRKNFGGKETLYAAFFFVLTVCVGQVVPLVISIISGTPLSYTILAPLIGHYSSITVTTTSNSQYSIYYILGFFGVNTIAPLKEIIFVLMMSIPMSAFLLTDINKVDIKNLLEFIFAESIFFVAFAITAEPQYLLAIIPFSTLLYFIKEDYRYILIPNIAFFLGSSLFFFSGTPVLYLFSNLNPSWQYVPDLTLSTNILVLFSFLYNLTLFILLGLIASNSIKIKSQLINNGKKKRRMKLFANSKKTGHVSMRGVVEFTTVVTITMLIAAPAINHVPKLMLFTPQASSAESNASTYGDFHNLTAYKISAPTTWILSDNYTRVHGSYYLSIPQGFDEKQINNSLESQFYSYNISFNLISIGSFNSSAFQLIPINSSLVKSVNFVNFTDSFTPNGTINLLFKLPLNVPASAIYENKPYIFYGIFSASISICGILIIATSLRKIK